MNMQDAVWRRHVHMLLVAHAIGPDGRIDGAL